MRSPHVIPFTSVFKTSVVHISGTPQSKVGGGVEGGGVAVEVVGLGVIGGDVAAEEVGEGVPGGVVAGEVRIGSQGLHMDCSLATK
jgi:hypothetical protein